LDTTLHQNSYVFVSFVRKGERRMKKIDIPLDLICEWSKSSYLFIESGHLTIRCCCVEFRMERSYNLINKEALFEFVIYVFNLRRINKISTNGKENNTYNA